MLLGRPIFKLKNKANKLGASGQILYIVNIENFEFYCKCEIRI